MQSLIIEKSNRASAPTKVPLSERLIALTWFLSQTAFTSQVLSHSGRSTSVCLADLQITQYREQGPCPSAPSCVCSDALIWAKMSKASFQAHERGQTPLPCGGSLRKAEVEGVANVTVCPSVGVFVQQQCIATYCWYTDTPVTSMKWRLQSIVRPLCHCFLLTTPSPEPATPSPEQKGGADLRVKLIRDNRTLLFLYFTVIMIPPKTA